MCVCVCVLRLFLEAEHINPHPDYLSVAETNPTASYTGGNPGSLLPILLTDVKRLQGFQETYTPNLKHVAAKSDMLLFTESGENHTATQHSHVSLEPLLHGCASTRVPARG